MVVLLPAFDPTAARVKTLQTITHDERLLLTIFVVPVLIGCAYASHRLWNVVRLLLTGDKPQRAGFVRMGAEPHVTIQICCYNEADVVTATIDAACSVDWPKDRLFVDVLDDSSDQTCCGIVELACRKWRERGVAANRRTRQDRIGYKAGNLAYHHENTLQTEFVAIFDADHRAHPDFLRRTVPHFFDENGDDKFEIGLVQCPWGYYNQHSNLLTECDALNLDAAFVVEQDVRARVFNFVSFNGTGGIWRKTAIDAGGGWQWDTITEDLDLSYRAYIAGYKFRFVSDVVQLLEIPASMGAFQSQKHRWTKGYSQVCVKSIGYFLTTPLLSPSAKFEAFMHLTTNTQYVIALWLMVWMPLLAYKELVVHEILMLCAYPAFVWFLVATVGVLCKAPTNEEKSTGKLGRLRRLVFILPSCALALGMSVAESFAFFEGFVSVDATFVTTPKEGDAETEFPFKGLGGRISSTLAEEFGKVKRRLSLSSEDLEKHVDGFFALPDRKVVVLVLEAISTFYLGVAAPVLVQRSIHDETEYAGKFSHVPATFLSLCGFFWVTGATIAASFQGNSVLSLRSLARWSTRCCRAKVKEESDLLELGDAQSLLTGETDAKSAATQSPNRTRSDSSCAFEDIDVHEFDERELDILKGGNDERHLTRRVFCHTSFFGSEIVSAVEKGAEGGGGDSHLPEINKHMKKVCSGAMSR